MSWTPKIDAHVYYIPTIQELKTYGFYSEEEKPMFDIYNKPILDEEGKHRKKIYIKDLRAMHPQWAKWYGLILEVDSDFVTMQVDIPNRTGSFIARKVPRLSEDIKEGCWETNDTMTMAKAIEIKNLTQ